MGVVVKYGSTLVGGEPGALILPKGWKGDNTKPGIIFSHGYAGDATEPLSGPLNPFIAPIVEAGFPVVSCGFGGNHWGNSAGQARVTTAHSFLTTLGCNPNKVGFIGQSMGHLNALNWAAANLSKTAFVIASMGVTDLANLYSQSEFTASINAAYGGAYSESSFGPAYNPQNNTAAKFTGLKWLGFQGQQDTTVLPQKVRDFRAAVGSTATLVEVAGSHGGSAVVNFSSDTALAFILASIA